MRKLILVILVILVILAAPHACEPQIEPAVCDPDMRAWVLECIAKANPYADEEPECETTAIHMFCGTTCALRVRGGIWCDVEERAP